jgi:cobalt/nickel transport system permease protein
VSHLHLPDGVLPLWLVAAGWIVTVALVALAISRSTEEERRRRIPLLGAVAALMLVGMSSEIVPIAYHINLTVVGGILLGPWLSIPTALVVVSLLALIGHGGVTVIGLNTVVIAAEMLIGAALFHAFVRLVGRERAGLGAAIATVVTLALTTTLLIGIVALGGPLAASRESGAFVPQDLRFENPFGHGVLGNAAFESAQGAAEQPEAPLDLRRFALMVYGLGSVGWLLEALVTAGIVGFLARVRPSLVFDGALSHPRSRLGDEGVHV